MKREMFSIGEPQEDKMSLPGMPGLCNLGRRYNVDILGEAGLKSFFTFVNYTIGVHLCHDLFYLGGIKRGGVLFNFFVVVFVI